MTFKYHFITLSIDTLVLRFMIWMVSNAFCSYYCQACTHIFISHRFRSGRNYKVVLLLLFLFLEAIRHAANTMVDTMNLSKNLCFMYPAQRTEYKYYASIFGKYVFLKWQKRQKKIVQNLFRRISQAIIFVFRISY